MSSSHFGGSRPHSRLASNDTGQEGSVFGVPIGGRSTPSALAQRRRSNAVFRGDDSDSEDEKGNDDTAQSKRKSVATIPKRPLVGEKRASSGTTSFAEPAWLQHDQQSYMEPPAPYQNYLSHDGSSSAAAYELLYQDNPHNTPPQSEYGIRRPTDQLNTLSSRKSLLDPSSFGFDAQNGDPRIIMREKGNDIERARPAPKTVARPLDDDDAHIELITVPGLGAEYSDQELKGMRDKGKRKISLKERLSGGKEWLRGNNRMFCCFTPRLLVIIAFAFLVLLSITLYFVIPRMPSFAVQTTKPLDAVPDGSSMITHHSPTNFSMDMNVNIRADNTGNWVPIQATKMTMDVTDLSTLKRVGKGTLDGHTFAARKKEVFKFPVHFAYASINVTGDQTWSHWINACGPKYDGTPRQSLNLQFSITMGIRGTLGTKGTSVQLADLECPFTLQNEQV